MDENANALFECIVYFQCSIWLIETLYTKKKNIVRSICMTNTNHASVSMFRFFYGSQHETNLTIALFCFLGWLPLSFELDDN